jgi:hypothetical protein
MAGMYENGVKDIMAGNTDLINDTISVLFIDTDKYTPDLVNDESQADIPTEAILAEITLTGKTLDGSTFRADDTTANAVSGDLLGAAIIIRNDGTESGSPLLAYIDNAPEFPITPDGGDLTLNWDTGSDGIFKL